MIPAIIQDYTRSSLDVFETVDMPPRSGQQAHQKSLGLIGLILLLCASAFADAKPPLLIAYFIPSDRTPIPGYVDRFDRVMTEVQGFYRRGMEAAGYGLMTFDLGRDTDGKLVVHVVRGKEPMHACGRNDSSKVSQEVSAALASQGVGIENRTLVIFQALLEWKDGKAIEVGPYVGYGNHLGGTAWIYDDALLDPRQLGSKTPGGYYSGPCSIGAFNSHYIGGTAHELGHALGLPHVDGPSSNPKHSLMGYGNHTYGEDLRGEGAGTYLLPASAMLLAKCRPFAGEIPGATLPATSALKALQATFTDGHLIIAGQLASKPPAFGLIAYNNSSNIPGDYDTTGWTTAVDDLGHFRLSLGELKPGPYELRLQVCHTNGPTSGFTFNYSVDSMGTPDLKPFSPAIFLMH